MDAHAHDTRPELATFLGLALALSSVFYWLIIRAGSLGAHGGAYVLALMWSPGVSALATRLLFQRGLRGQGWRPGEARLRPTPTRRTSSSGRVSSSAWSMRC